MRASASASISFSVSGVSGQVSATKSACGSSARQRRHRMNRVGGAAPARRIAAQPDHPHVERLGQPGETAADIAEADDQQRLAAKLVLALGEISDHAAPDAAAPGCRAPPAAAG